MSAPADPVIDGMRRLIAACPAWQTVCGVATAAEALQRVHGIEIPPEATGNGGSPLPCCVVTDWDNLEDSADQLGTEFGEIGLELFLVRQGETDGEAARHVLAVFRQLRKEMLTRAGQPSGDRSEFYWNARRITKLVAAQELMDARASLNCDRAMWLAAKVEWT